MNNAFIKLHDINKEPFLVQVSKLISFGPFPAAAHAVPAGEEGHVPEGVNSVIRVQESDGSYACAETIGQITDKLRLCGCYVADEEGVV